MRLLIIVETNWLIGVILKQDAASGYLSTLVERGEIEIAIPEYSFYETGGIIKTKLTRRCNAINEFLSTLKGISRSERYSDVCQDVKIKLKRVLHDTQKEGQEVDRIITKIKQLVLQLPYSEKISARAKLRNISSKPPFKLSDCEIYESILDLIRKTKEYDKIIFYTADTEDFDHSEIRKELRKLKTEIYFDSGETVQRVHELI